MSDYIDRAALGIGLCNRDVFVFENKRYADGWNAAVKILMKAPTVDVQEVRHGKWIKDDSDGCYCSACEWYADYDFDYVTNNGLGNDDFIYCPHCGAKMDGGIE